MAKIDAFFKLMNDQGASDLHLVSGSQPILRVHGDLERVKYKILENDELKATSEPYCSATQATTPAAGLWSNSEFN